LKLCCEGSLGAHSVLRGMPGAPAAASPAPRAPGLADSPVGKVRPRPKSSPGGLGTPRRAAAGLRTVSSSAANALASSPRSAAAEAAKPAALSFDDREAASGEPEELQQLSRAAVAPPTPGGSERRDVSSVRVLVRVRPMSARERKAGEARSLLCNGDTISMGKRAFRFDNVLAEQSSQDNVFCELADQVDGFLSVRAMKQVQRSSPAASL